MSTLTPPEIVADYRFDEMLKIEDSGVDVWQIFPPHFIWLFLTYKRVLHKTRVRAAKKIYYWWIPICYDMSRECGRRTWARGVDAALAMMYGEDEGVVA